MNDRLQSIDMLRGLAILAVLAIHCPHDAPGGFRENIWFLPSFLAGYGYLGVHLFVLISGFCIHRRAAVGVANTGEYRLDWGKFWKRRIWRLYPPYVVAIVISLVAATVHQRFVVNHEQIGWNVLLHLTMLHNLTEFGTSLGNGSLWSLGMEEQLYAGYVLLILLFRRSSTMMLLCIIGIVTIGWRLSMPVAGPLNLGPFELGKWYLWPLMFWLHWTLGAIAVEVAEGIRTVPRWCSSISLACIALLIAMLLNRQLVELFIATKGTISNGVLIAGWWQPWIFTTSELFALLGFYIGLNWLIEKEGSCWTAHRVARYLAYLGRVSYSVYLVHIPIIYTLEMYVTLQPIGWQWLVRMILFVGTSIIGGLAFFHVIEKRFVQSKSPIKWSHQRLRTKVISHV
ncbi:acyltransferase [Roseiconus lacunae]|uniref:acyltransferase family protein n=1 Tax=Roseiconus lacunae TaxID=2605694 RepID=UPI003093BA8D|nr:acyltransferase [Stieleria sp. HD01]